VSRLYDLTHPSQFQRLVAPIGVAARRPITLAAETVLHRALPGIALRDRAYRATPAVRTAKMETAEVLVFLPQAPSPAPRGTKRRESGSVDAARGLWDMSETDWRHTRGGLFTPRGIDLHVIDVGALRFHGRCFFRDSDDTPKRTFRAMIAAVTNESGPITGAHHTWLDPDSAGEKAQVSSPRRDGRSSWRWVSIGRGLGRCAS
jgi:hypothetical protein